MFYIVYVNHPTSKAMVHSTDCWKYTKRRRNKTIHGYWSKTLKIWRKLGTLLKIQINLILAHVHFASKAKLINNVC